MYDKTLRRAGSGIAQAVREGVDVAIEAGTAVQSTREVTS
jgi:hypothetical protein